MTGGSVPRGGVTCLLCNATISVRIGNYGKLKLHLETNHDVFFEHDLLMAINFLEANEREIIIEKVLPRMNLCLQKSNNTKEMEDGKLDIEKRLFDGEPSKPGKRRREEEEVSASPSSSKATTTKLEKINFEEVVEDEEESPHKKSKYEDDAPSLVDEESLEISLDESEEVYIAPDDVEDQPEASSSSIKKIKKTGSAVGKDVVECGICHNSFKKKSMLAHTRRCELKQKIHQMGLEKHKNEQQKPTESFNYPSDDDQENSLVINENEDIETDKGHNSSLNSSKVVSRTCEPCNKTFSSSSNLARHKRLYHK